MAFFQTNGLSLRITVQLRPMGGMIAIWLEMFSIRILVQWFLSILLRIARKSFMSRLNCLVEPSSVKSERQSEEPGPKFLIKSSRFDDFFCKKQGDRDRRRIFIRFDVKADTVVLCWYQDDPMGQPSSRGLLAQAVRDGRCEAA